MDCSNNISSSNPIESSSFNRFHWFSRLKDAFRRMTGDSFESGLDAYWETVERVKAVRVSDKTTSQLSDRMKEIAPLVQTGPAVVLDTLPTPDKVGEKNPRARKEFTDFEIETFAIVGEASRAQLD
jgi:hypothetical protein